MKAGMRLVSDFVTDLGHNSSVRRCPTCGYDLRGHATSHSNTEVICPECGNRAPPPTGRRLVEPGPLWHVLIALSFGLPLILTAFEAADQMVWHAGGAIAYAPDWLKMLIGAGGVSMIVCLCHAWIGTRRRVRLVSGGLALLLVYMLTLVYLSSWIEWYPYR